ncbi:spermatogenesis-associated serine-rich protein 1-like isoform X6 [Dreissena polymorpha]|uniref:spermatogenesis-associated serine-rich protein 1-like isoform X6 n=1 Tax=Dreissena polymorpha TaxID=45954 RepID=UPI002264F8D3|nr:spermatogenesis-associated serine-rich protein 1-like isoform X6 [Dreissena polymorpha]XP_052244607.1 spermatogenesis-associated serine-rich protein 1-like isoform X6 [Dreissena polymorpha]
MAAGTSPTAMACMTNGSHTHRTSNLSTRIQGLIGNRASSISLTQPTPNIRRQKYLRPTGRRCGHILACYLYGAILQDTYMNSSNEWLLDPGLSNRGMKCHFNGRHQATHTSADEITHSMLFGRGRNLETIDKRNGIGESAPGDKPYKTPEYSSQFHKLGSTLPVIDFGYVPEDANSPWHHQPDTFVPLKPSLNEPREPFRVKARREEKQSEMMTVAALDEWRPATPLKPEKIDEKK